MDLATLIVALKPLLASPEQNWDQIASLLEDNVELSEFEVARHYVNAALGGSAKKQLRSVDPAIRKQGVDRVGLLYPRADAAQALRPMVLDPDPAVRGRARAISRSLGLDDVALPDSRRTINPNWHGPQSPGGWNPSGWLFGSRPPQPTRKGALKKNGLSAISSRAGVLKFFGLSDEDLARLMRPGVAAGAPYVEFEIEKASGGSRRITAPRAALRAAQRKILRDILDRLPHHDACHGFVRGRSVVSNAAPHVKQRVVIKMDLRDFFPSIHYRRVSGLFRELGYNAEVAGILAGLTTHRAVLSSGAVAWPGFLPQGAPTSPAIANRIARRLDARLSGLAKKVGANYTRYADDLTFSFATEPDIDLGRLCWWIDQVCGQEGFVENVAKRRILRPGNQQRVTGIVVNEAVHIPRSAHRRFRAILHNCRVNGVDAEARGHHDFSAYLRGFAAYVKMVQPALGTKLSTEVEALLGTP